MQAIVFHTYGSPDVLRVEDVDRPAVKDDQVLVRVRAASVNPVDWHRMTGQPFFLRAMTGLTRPKDARLGADLAGRVETVGKNVTTFRPGDDVFGISIRTLAEYVSVAEAGLARKPANLTFEQAAAVPLAATTALQGLRDKGKIQPGQRVLINGAAGGVGTFAVQIAKSFGTNVTAVCSTRNVDMVRSLGADRVIDYTREDFTQTGQPYDLIFDLAGTRSLSACRRILTPNGALVLGGSVNTRALDVLVGMIELVVVSRFTSQKLVTFLTRRSRDDLIFLKDLIETEKVTPVIDRTYPLAESAAAIRYLMEGHARGKVVITLAQ